MLPADQENWGQVVGAKGTTPSNNRVAPTPRKRGSGEHRRKACGAWQRSRVASKSGASLGREDAPASQLLNVKRILQLLRKKPYRRSG